MNSCKHLLARAWYHESIAEFLASDADRVFGILSRNSQYDVVVEQSRAWLAQINLLKSQLGGLEGAILFEFDIPRMGKRIDTVIIVGPMIFVVEFKVGSERYERAAINQVWDYGLDLKNFHEASHSSSILPILLIDGVDTTLPMRFEREGDGVFTPVSIGFLELRRVMNSALELATGKYVDSDRWIESSYRPTPTIIEAARALYQQHSVEAIARYDAGAKNLRITASRVDELVQQAKLLNQKIICFVTGVPGAGKTLVGLNVATQRREEDHQTPAVFLSGNGPLVEVLREALTRDEVERSSRAGKKRRKGVVSSEVKSFIQNVHHFRDDGLRHEAPPPEHIAVFDEAQRAWNLQQTANFMARKKNRPGFRQTEAEFLISFMNRHEDWATIVCLVGGGQEINTGEAGIGAWLEAVSSNFPDWHLYISSKLTDTEYASGDALAMVRDRSTTHFDDSLHLAVSMRSFRAEHVSTFVKLMLDLDVAGAQATLAHVLIRYPIVVTRSLTAAKRWIRSRARGSERFGLVASSKAQRLKPHAIDVRVNINPVHWFLNDREDTRSSYYLEDAATEFQVQGLELDWVCVNWDGDLRFNQSGWGYHDFRGSKWCNVKNEDNRRYLLNAYRVLMTRARQGMVIFVPLGDSDDSTRKPEYYDATFEYLTEIGLPIIS